MAKWGEPYISSKGTFQYAVKWNELLCCKTIWYLMKLNQAEHSPRQWNECVKHAAVLDQSSVELASWRMAVLSATLRPGFNMKQMYKKISSNLKAKGMAVWMSCTHKKIGKHHRLSSTAGERLVKFQPLTINLKRTFKCSYSLMTRGLGKYWSCSQLPTHHRSVLHDHHHAHGCAHPHRRISLCPARGLAPRSGNGKKYSQVIWC